MPSDKHMTEIIVTDRQGQERSVEFSPGITLMQTLCEAGFDELLALCGGVCSCGTCHVYVEPGSTSALPPMDEDEDALLDASAHRRKHSRLSCQIRLTAEQHQMRITIAPED